jgi:nucleoside-diphosphate-sugar epimerase
MNVLIVGGSGFLGKELYLFLKKKNINIYNLSRTYNRSKNFITCDISKKSELYKRLNKLNIKFNFVINLSGQISADNKEMKETIINGNQNLIDYFDSKKTIIIFMSSILVYMGSKKILSESGKLSLLNGYSLFKIKAENLYKKKCKKFIILRLGNIYDSSFKKKGLFKNILKSINYSKTINLLNIKSSRSYLHINDFCEAIYRCLISSGNKKLNKIYNLSHQNINNMEVIKTFEKIFRVKIHCCNMNKIISLDPIININSKKFIRNYDFTFKHNLHKELKKYEKKLF